MSRSNEVDSLELLPPQDGAILPNGSTALVLPRSVNPALPADYELIRERLLELLDMLHIPNLPLKQRAMMAGAIPLLKMGIANEEMQRLHLLIACLSGMLRAVLDLECSRQEYEEQVEPLLMGLASLFSTKH